jgi:hypothetical protein
METINAIKKKLTKWDKKIQEIDSASIENEIKKIEMAIMSPPRP